MFLLLDGRKWPVPDFRTETTTASLQAAGTELCVHIQLTAHWWKMRKCEVKNAAEARRCVAAVFECCQMFVCTE
jgi:hypothetical protein